MVTEWGSNSAKFLSQTYFNLQYICGHFIAQCFLFKILPCKDKGHVKIKGKVIQGFRH